MQCKQLIERSGRVILRNLNINSTNIESNRDKWISGSGYGFYSIPYEYNLQYGRKYYCRFTYKFTTTNQSPTWCTFYHQGGMATVCGVPSNGMKAGIESTTSGIATYVNTRPSYAIYSGTLYNGESNHISGVTSYCKNVLIYDITDLYSILSNEGLDPQEWCDAHLVWQPRYTDYDITSLLPKNSVNSVKFNEGAIIADEFIEPEAIIDLFPNDRYPVIDPYFDKSNPVDIYNNNGNGTVTHERVSASDQNSPFKNEHPYVLKITTNGSASPGLGGLIVNHMAKANGIYVEKIVAKIPKTHYLTPYYNAQGSGSSVKMLSDNAGTGDWKEYTVLYKCGSSGSFSSGGHLALNAFSGNSTTSVTWYVAYANSNDITGHENLKNHSILGTTFQKGIVNSHQFDNNLFINGRCFNKGNNYIYDMTDHAGNGVGSIIQNVGKGISASPLLPVEANSRYKISYWVKCKNDMSSYLTAILPVASDGKEITHSITNYVDGTKTQLTADLKTNDTSMSVKDGTAWKDRSYGHIGFRSSYYLSYNDLGNSNYDGSSGIIKSTNGISVTFKQPYTGPLRKSGTYVVESYDGGTYIYTQSKGDLPNDNTWKYVEGYFGHEMPYDGWDGRDNPTTWYALPGDTKYIRVLLNIYNNNGTVPIKYSDIRVEKVSGDGSNTLDKVIID